jgi:hypothetical protein
MTGVEQLSHLTVTLVGFMCISGFFNNVISDYLWARSVVLTSSTVATVGLSIAIPMAMVADLLVQGTSPTLLSGSGALLVVVGFCLVNITKDQEIDLFTYCFRNSGAYELLAGNPLAVTAMNPIKKRSSHPL